jgi:hypothetical protein
VTKAQFTALYGPGGAVDPTTGERLGLIATAVAGDGGWVDLTAPLVVRAGGGFVAVPGSPRFGE